MKGEYPGVRGTLFPSRTEGVMNELQSFKRAAEAHDEDNKRWRPASTAADESAGTKMPSDRKLGDTDSAILNDGQSDSTTLYFRDIGRTSLIDIDEERRLANLIRKGDPDARQKMIRSNLRLVIRIARDYSGFNVPFMDLISEGNVGLVKAVDRYDPDRGCKFSTYGAWWIKQSMKRAIANFGREIRLPVYLVDRIARLRRTNHELTELIGREPTNSELAEELEMTVEKVAHLKDISVRPLSLNAPRHNEDAGELSEFVGDERSIDPAQQLNDKSKLGSIECMLDRLTEKEAEIIRLRYGLDGEKARTLEEVGLLFGVTRERVRQIQVLALRKMRKLYRYSERIRNADEARKERFESAKAEVVREYLEAGQLRSADA